MSGRKAEENELSMAQTIIALRNENAYDELVYTPAKFHVRRHIVKKYKCLACGAGRLSI